MDTPHPFTLEEVNAILVARFNGESLQSVADRFNTNRVLIRRIESKYMNRFKVGHTYN
jgi:hypothetical protein